MHAGVGQPQYPIQSNPVTEQQIAAAAPAPSTSAGEAGTASSEDKKKPSYYFEFAKRKWESEDTFRLPDGTYWPEACPDRYNLLCFHGRAQKGG